MKSPTKPKRPAKPKPAANGKAPAMPWQLELVPLEVYARRQTHDYCPYRPDANFWWDEKNNMIEHVADGKHYKVGPLPEGFTVIDIAISGIGYELRDYWCGFFVCTLATAAEYKRRYDIYLNGWMQLQDFLHHS